MKNRRELSNFLCFKALTFSQCLLVQYVALPRSIPSHFTTTVRVIGSRKALRISKGVHVANDSPMIARVISVAVFHRKAFNLVEFFGDHTMEVVESATGMHAVVKPQLYHQN